MDKQSELPVVQLELNSGMFRIKTPEAIYEITVKPDSSLTQVVEKIVEVEKPSAEQPAAAKEQEQQAPAASGQPGDEVISKEDFYKEISEEMYHEIGKLARDLSLSIKQMPGEPKKVDIQKAGVDLESAKSMLEDVVKMTENATMQIMDISENIHNDCETIKQNLSDIKNLNFLGNDAAPSQPGENPVSTFLQSLIERENGLKEVIAALPVQEDTPAPAESAPPQPQPASTRKVYDFDVDVVFQTLYELCTNEAVKKHIKSMREDQQEAFDIPGIKTVFSDMASEVSAEENFFNFPLENILKTLFKYSSDEKSKQILKKMHQTSGDIFLDSTLPIEGTVQEQEIPDAAAQTESASAEAAADESSGKLAQALELIDKNIAMLSEQAEYYKSESPGFVQPEGYSMVKKEDHDKLISALESSDQVIQSIITRISNILEALTFQDLSGQRIVKIADMLTSVQVQLLGILVSFGVKLKKRQEGAEIDDWETEEEVDKMMSSVAAQAAEGQEKKGPLNQDAVDKLLADLGF